MSSLITTVFGRVHLTSQRGTLLQRLNNVMALRRSRARLAKLEPHFLADVGLTEKEAQVEAKRTVWDAPANWKH